jgi:hypothetical protein
MECELQAVPIEMPLSSYQKKIVLTEYIPEIMKKRGLYKVFNCNSCAVSIDFFCIASQYGL